MIYLPLPFFRKKRFFLFFTKKTVYSLLLGSEGFFRSASSQTCFRICTAPLLSSVVKRAVIPSCCCCKNVVGVFVPIWLVLRSLLFVATNVVGVVVDAVVMFALISPYSNVGCCKFGCCLELVCLHALVCFLQNSREIAQIVGGHNVGCCMHVKRSDPVEKTRTLLVSRHCCRLPHVVANLLLFICCCLFVC